MKIIIERKGELFELKTKVYKLDKCKEPFCVLGIDHPDIVGEIDGDKRILRVTFLKPLKNMK